MINVDLNNVQTPGKYERPAPGGYVGQIMQVDHEQEKQYIRLYVDIAEGDFANYFETLFDHAGFWGLTNIRSYKRKALPFFKAMIDAVTASNPGFKWTGEEQELDGKLVGFTLKNEQYVKSDGSIGMRQVIDKFVSVDDIRKGNFEVPETKYIECQNTSFAPTSVDHINTSNGRLSGAAKEDFMKVPDNMEEGLPFK